MEGEMDKDKSTFIEWPTRGILELGFITKEEHNVYCIEFLKSMCGHVDAPAKQMLQNI